MAERTIFQWSLLTAVQSGTAHGDRESGDGPVRQAFETCAGYCTQKYVLRTLSVGKKHLNAQQPVACEVNRNSAVKLER